MPKLPAYVFRRQNGSYRYKRNVPKKLRHLIGKDTLYRQLGESYSEAMNALPKVHLEIEQLFAAEETMPSNERALAFIRAALGEEVAKLACSGKQALGDKSQQLETNLPTFYLTRDHYPKVTEHFRFF